MSSAPQKSIPRRIVFRKHDPCFTDSKIGDGHDLKSTQFSKNRILQAIFDNKKTLRRAGALDLIKKSVWHVPPNQVESMLRPCESGCNQQDKVKLMTIHPNTEQRKDTENTEEQSATMPHSKDKLTLATD